MLFHAFEFPHFAFVILRALPPIPAFSPHVNEQLHCRCLPPPLEKEMPSTFLRRFKDKRIAEKCTSRDDFDAIDAASDAMKLFAVMAA